jgi:carbamoyltransferase
LIEAFRDLTRVPVLLNTSFNENEPVVCQPVEVLDCFLRTRMDRRHELPAHARDDY